ncbi:hypothetical protein [Ornithinimicrobium cerasi]|uniref:hypothetical protein n=1 Tax=Ornithinimicrobium cerasi TaxID=2248773 RepID=UPI001F3FC8CE|nr:hypothetical protein [Ornithinimicrobium cerasi]
MGVDVRGRSAGPPAAGGVRSSPSTARARDGSGFGAGVALATAALTLVTFALALTALPDKVPYPFTDEVIVAQWPGDYLWMFPAMVLMVLFVALVAVVHQHVEPERKVYTQIALCLATIAAAVLLIDYYVQSSVMPLALEKGQLDGWALLTQYNPGGVFIALEELGYLLMSLSLLCLAPALSAGSRVERVLRWVLVASPASVAAGLGVVSVVQGRDRGDVFEILVISIVWLTLIVAGPLLAVVLRRPVPVEGRRP